MRIDFLLFRVDIFNEIINKFDFNDNDVNINSFLEEFSTPSTDHPKVPNSDLTPDDPLLSSSNASLNYSDFRSPILQQTQNKATNIQPANISEVISPSPQIKTSPTHVTASSVEVPNQQTVVYHIADKSISSNSFVTSAAAQIPIQQPATTVLSNLTPIQMVFNNVETTSFQPVQEYSEVSETSKQPIVVQSGGLLSANKVVATSTKSIILNPTVVYTGSSNSIQSLQLINTSNGTILATQVPMPIMMEQEQTKPPKVKEVKRSTHNAIERRYRTSINDKILELKNMLVGDSGKLNKSAILKRSIEKINDLESENYQLKLQNARLREMLLAQGPILADESSLKTLLLQKAIKPQKRRYTQSSSTGSGSEYGNNASPPPSDESNPSLSPAHSDTSVPSPLGNDEISTDFDPAAKRNKKMDNITHHGMSSMSKLTLCAFMFAIITINPFESLFSDSKGATLLDDSFVATSQRRILQKNTATMNFFETFLQNVVQQFSNSFMALILNAIILIVCLVKLCFHSDPVMNFRSPVAEKYFKQKLIADTEFDQGNASAAFMAYEKCLQMFGVTLPQTWFELVWQTVAEFLRCCAHRLRFGQWLSRKFGRIICSDETHEHALNSAQELAIILNRCNQIHLSQNVRDGCGLILSMYAVNMAEVARNIAPLTLIDVYITASLRAKKNYVHVFSWMCSRYYLYKARSEAALLYGQKLPPKYDWIFNSAYGYKYMCKFSFDGACDNFMSLSLFNSPVNPLDNLSMVFAVCINSLIFVARFSTRI